MTILIIFNIRIILIQKRWPEENVPLRREQSGAKKKKILQLILKKPTFGTVYLSLEWR